MSALMLSVSKDERRSRRRSGTTRTRRTAMDTVFLPLLAGCLLALASALAVVLVRRPVYAAVGLLAHSLSLAALFALLAANLVAVGQVIIYSGAIVVLFLFVVTLLPTGGAELAPSSNRVASALVAGGALPAPFAAALASGVPPPVPTAGGGGEAR